MTLAIKSILTKLLISLTTQKFLEWLLFWIAGAIVESTKNDKDDELLIELKKAYYGE
jgi:hypothetical protein